ncbi:MAG: aminodeoxychorismate synthase component I [Halieaceae bacterium]
MKNRAVFIQELPYQTDSCELFERLRGLPGALLFDSAHPYSRSGRFDILSADPAEDISFSCLNTTPNEDILKYFGELGRLHQQHCEGLVAPAEELPFCGGLAGHLDYGLGKLLQHLPAEAGSGARVGFYDWALVQDHLRQRCSFVALPGLSSARRRQLLERLQEPHAVRGPSPAAFQLQDRFRDNMDRNAYRQAFQQIQHYIQAGDCYQVNLARRFSAPCQGDPWQAYRKLRPVAAAHFSAYLEYPDKQLLCLSPERFMRLAGRRVETRPIKGTRPRHQDPAADHLAAEELRHSAKDRAENLMIVDLLRNDIGRNCQPGSIQVERMFELESYPTVHHLVSTISGELLPEREAAGLLRDSFPGGSITGAPKRRAMEIIEELEPHSRQSYCGSMFYISADGRMDSNIAIRTLLCQAGEIHCWGGGGIVADSEWELEYQEGWDKVGRFIDCLEAGLTGAASAEVDIPL